MKSNIEQYNEHIDFETKHRKKWIKKAVPTRRYIKAIINIKIKESILSRKTGDKTTDPRIRRQVLRKTGGKCYLCFRQYTRNTKLAERLPKLYFTRLQIDHVVPFSKFGPNDISNYMPACSECNRKKSDLSLAEYRAGVRRPWRKRNV